MNRSFMYVAVAMFGLACFACENPMEVASEASAHTEDTASSPARASSNDESSPSGSTEESNSSTEEPNGTNPAKTDMYPLPGEGGFAQSEDSDGSSGEASDDDSLTGSLNLNQASREELELLPGVGPAIAERIDSYRSKRRFENIDDIQRVRGIGDATFADMKSYLSVSGETTLSE